MHCQFFEIIRYDAFIVKYQDRYWIKTKTDWTIVQEINKNNHTNINKSDSQIVTRFEIYTKTEYQCGSTKPLQSTNYEDIYIIYENGYDMNTGRPNKKTLITLKTKNSLKYPPKR